MPGLPRFLRPGAALVAAALAVAGLLGAPVASAAASQACYVSPGGSDANAGTSAAAPLRTLQAAQARVRQALSANLVPSVQVAGGTYELPSALAFGPADSGRPGSPVVWQAAPGSQVVLAAGRQLQDAWTPDTARPGVFTAQIGTGIPMDGLFVNGRRQVLARYPNVNPAQPILDGSPI